MLLEKGTKKKKNENVRLKLWDEKLLNNRP